MTRGLRVCFDARDIQYDARKRARHKRCFSPAVCCRSAGMSRPRQLRPTRLTCEKRQRKSEGRCSWVAGGGRDGRVPTLAQVRWGGVAGAVRAAGEALISDLARTETTDRRFAPVLARASAHSQCTWDLSAELSVFASSKLKCQCTLCPALSVQNTLSAGQPPSL